MSRLRWNPSNCMLRLRQLSMVDTIPALPQAGSRPSCDTRFHNESGSSFDRGNMWWQRGSRDEDYLANDGGDCSGVVDLALLDQTTTFRILSTIQSLVITSTIK